MKNSIAVLFILAALAACQKEQLDSKPEWLAAKVDELIDDQFCDITTVTVYEYEGAYYYHIYCQVWSCLFCNVYDADGNQISFADEAYTNFMDEKEEVEEYPACE